MSLVEEWPEGLGFHLADAQLVDYHLRKKLDGKTQTFLVITDLEIYEHEPWDLFFEYNGHELSDFPSDGQECFFFCPQWNKTLNDRLFPSNKKKKLGFWKCTCWEWPVRDQDGKQIGTKKIFVCYECRQRYIGYHVSFLDAICFPQDLSNASAEATIESESQNESSNFDVPERCKSSAQQTQIDHESILLWDEHWGI